MGKELLTHHNLQYLRLKGVASESPCMDAGGVVIHRTGMAVWQQANFAKAIRQ